MHICSHLTYTRLCDIFVDHISNKTIADNVLVWSNSVANTN